ncbi:hypothetical protein CL630_01310 [bacterium]|nr:hypothetical protein [bacterium]|tara:strand:+ start:8711 stop:9124 length:414 start_codon:yes stop_codon:yes gene_type:complete
MHGFIANILASIVKTKDRFLTALMHGAHKRRYSDRDALVGIIVDTKNTSYAAATLIRAPDLSTFHSDVLVDVIVKAGDVHGAAATLMGTPNLSDKNRNNLLNIIIKVGDKRYAKVVRACAPNLSADNRDALEIIANG